MTANQPIANSNAIGPGSASVVVEAKIEDQLFLRLLFVKEAL